MVKVPLQISQVSSSSSVNVAAQVNITAEPRQEVTLTCRAPINERLDPHDQDPSYRNRVDLQDRHLKIRGISLVLKNVKMEDSGRYECQVVQKGTISMIRISLKNETISSSDQEGHQQAQVDVTAEPGQDITLPCKVPDNKTIIDVEWNKPELALDNVLFYRDGRLDPDYQHPSYRNRVDLQDRQMKDGDVSLVLNNVKMEDTGTYECRVFLEGTNGLTKEPINITFLLVHQLGEF
ncbi:neural cell adhesion molecule 2-like [Stegastes partitus]|uniref:Neural cell adhesion molecule 2-like n=1 Tax=Stegastes partitus TaxID=144197 RepID=A0A9Y4KA67_9TELE|nr:PREDICTED: neural cell adhesion molecule 2-like [Stegastes partitus]